MTVSLPVPLEFVKLGSELVNAALTPAGLFVPRYVPGAANTCPLTVVNVPNAVPVLGAITVPAAPVTVNVTVPSAPIVMLPHEPRPT